MSSYYFSYFTDKFLANCIMLHDQLQMMFCSQSESFVTLALFSVECSVNSSHSLINLIVEVRLTYSLPDKGHGVFDNVVEA